MPRKPPINAAGDTPVSGAPNASWLKRHPACNCWRGHTTCMSSCSTVWEYYIDWKLVTKNVRLLMGVRVVAVDLQRDRPCQIRVLNWFDPELVRRWCPASDPATDASKWILHNGGAASYF